ncbi:MAG: helix-turn-helix domain-containing protein, partial [Lachnospiraceae bacterium]|nr:helix-turn-helix domain-containing protein [Lachnospiraceae bacterium]
MKTRIKELRESRGMSQEALAGLVNSSQQAICRYEKEITVPPSDIILEVANYFEVSTDYVLYHSDS